MQQAPPPALDRPEQFARIRRQKANGHLFGKESAEQLVGGGKLIFTIGPRFEHFLGQLVRRVHSRQIGLQKRLVSLQQLAQGELEIGIMGILPICGTEFPDHMRQRFRQLGRCAVAVTRTTTFFLLCHVSLLFHTKRSPLPDGSRPRR